MKKLPKKTFQEDKEIQQEIEDILECFPDFTEFKRKLIA